MQVQNPPANPQKSESLSCPVLKLDVPITRCVSDCRFVCRKNGVCQAFADRVQASGTQFVLPCKPTKAAENALIALHVTPVTAVNPPAPPEERIMDATVAEKNKSRTAAATAARLKKMAERRKLEAASVKKGSELATPRRTRATKPSQPVAEQMMTFVETKPGSGLFEVKQLSMTDFMAAAHSGRKLYTAADWRCW